VANPGAKFCQECATSLTASAPRPTAALPTALSTGQSERKLVTVLFADLVGFTPFAEERDAEDVRDTLTRYFDLAREVIERYGGTVEKFIGDAVMAVWGAPVIHEDDAELATRAGLELVEAVPSLGQGIQARCGILTGEAAVTLGATNQGMVAGDIVNTASRLQSAAPPGSVLVGEATYRAASKAIAFEEAGEQLLKGKQAPVGAWRAVRVVGERGGRNRTEALEAPFVGRHEELRLLKDLFHATGREKRLRVVSVVGPAGIGKSRLAHEFLKYIDGLSEVVYWHSGRSPAYGEGISFWALGEMVRERAGLREADDDATTRAKVREMVDQWVPDSSERPWLESSLLTLLGVEAGMAADELFAAWRTFFERVAIQGSVVLVFEDMHFADAGLLDFVDHLLEWSRGFPIYVVTMARPDLIERRPSWGAGKRSFVSMYVEPLPESDMRQLLSGLVPGLPEKALATIVARADGIPLYAVETVRTLLADGRLIKQDGVYVPQGDLTNLSVPDTLTALIAARLDALEEVDRRIVHDAAVLGQSFTNSALAAVTGVAEDELDGRLASLVRRELLEREMDPRSPERGQYEFVQALIREVAYNTLSKKDRKRLHLAAARYFESLGSDEIAGALASHYLAAHANASEPAEAAAVASQARIALKAAAARAEALGSFDQAVTFLEQAVSVAQDPAEQAALLMQAATDAGVASHSEQAEDFARRAVAVAAESGDADLRARAVTEHARALVRLRRPEDARIELEPALDELSSASEESQALLRVTLARTLWALREASDAYRMADDVLQVAERHDYPAIVVDGLWVKTNVLWHFGRRREALALSEAARALAEERGLTDSLLRIMNATINAVSEFDLGAAVDAYHNFAALARRTGRRAELHNSVASFGYLGFISGLWDDALTDVEAVLAEEPSEGERLVLLNNWADIQASRGESISEALAEMTTLERNSTQRLARLYRMDAEANLAITRGDFKRASMTYQETADIDAANGNEVYYRSGRCELWAGDVEAARVLQSKLAETGGYGPITNARRQTLAAGIAAAEGRAGDAMPLYRVALKNWRDTRCGWDEALTGIDMAMLLDATEPEVAEVVISTHAILERLRAVPYLELLDRAASRGPAVVQRTPAASAEAVASGS
jgi:class 3 adenylate cyclase/tetratricopeptide (TPR) repeat protein